MAETQRTIAAKLKRYDGFHSMTLEELKRQHHDVGLTIKEIASRGETDTASVVRRMNAADIEKLCDACRRPVSEGGSPEIRYCSERCATLDAGGCVICPDCGEEIGLLGRWVAHRDRHGETRPILKKTSNYTPDSDSVKWEAQRGAALQRAGRSCELCGDETDLEVHHLIKRRFFESEERSHALENLVVLCCGCHARVEDAGARSTLNRVLSNK